MDPTQGSTPAKLPIKPATSKDGTEEPSSEPVAATQTESDHSDTAIHHRKTRQERNAPTSMDPLLVSLQKHHDRVGREYTEYRKPPRPKDGSDHQKKVKNRSKTSEQKLDFSLPLHNPKTKTLCAQPFDSTPEIPPDIHSKTLFPELKSSADSEPGTAAALTGTKSTSEEASHSLQGKARGSKKKQRSSKKTTSVNPVLKEFQSLADDCRKWASKMTRVQQDIKEQCPDQPYQIWMSKELRSFHEASAQLTMRFAEFVNEQTGESVLETRKGKGALTAQEREAYYRSLLDIKRFHTQYYFQHAQSFKAHLDSSLHGVLQSGGSLDSEEFLEFQAAFTHSIELYITAIFHLSRQLDIMDHKLSLSSEEKVKSSILGALIASQIYSLSSHIVLACHEKVDGCDSVGSEKEILRASLIYRFLPSLREAIKSCPLYAALETVDNFFALMGSDSLEHMDAHCHRILAADLLGMPLQAFRSTPARSAVTHLQVTPSQKLNSFYDHMRACLDQKPFAHWCFLPDQKHGSGVDDPITDDAWRSRL